MSKELPSAIVSPKCTTPLKRVKENAIFCHLEVVFFDESTHLLVRMGYTWLNFSQEIVW